MASARPRVSKRVLSMSKLTATFSPAWVRCLIWVSAWARYFFPLIGGMAAELARLTAGARVCEVLFRVVPPAPSAHPLPAHCRARQPRARRGDPALALL